MRDCDRLRPLVYNRREDSYASIISSERIFGETIWSRFVVQHYYLTWMVC